MATILAIKETVNDDIRTKTGAGTILKTEHADIEDAILNEIRDRGSLQAATTGAMASISKDNTRLVVVKNVGVFQALETGDDPNGTTTFASADAGWLWEMAIATTVLENIPDGTSTDQDYEYTLDNGLAIWMVKVYPASAYSLAISLTEGGNEILDPTPLEANKWNTFRFDVEAYGSDQSVFFEGVASETIFAIYRVSIPLPS